MVTMTSHKRHGLEWIDEHARRFSDFHLRIWNPLRIQLSSSMRSAAMKPSG